MGNDFEQVKQRIDLGNLIQQETGLKMGRHHLERCPFCDGHDCFSVKNGSFNCFQCPGNETGGDVFSFLERFHGIESKDALHKAAEVAGIVLEAPKRIRLSRTEKLLAEAAEYYHGVMMDNGTRAYLTEDRGHRLETLQRMRVGFSDGNLVSAMGHKKFSNDEMLTAGIARERDIEGRKVVVDMFGPGFLIYPHFIGGKVRHISTKDPRKQRPPFQLPVEKRHKDWRFYNQDAIDIYSEIILLEGEDDLQTVLDTGAGNVIGMIGQISEVQIKALASTMRKKILYLWMDNDLPNAKGKRPGHNYIRKICGALKNIEVRIILYPDGIDPDEYLRGFQGDRRQEIKRLMATAVDYLSWEIGQAGNLSNLEERLEALKEYKVFNAIALLPEIKQQIFAEKLVGIGFSKKAVAEQLEERLDIRRKLNIYFETLPDKSKADPNIVADIIYQGFTQDGMFFYDNAATVFLMYNHQIYEISNNRPFNALMKKNTMLLPTRDPGRSVWESLASEGFNSGNQINFSSWTHTDRIKDAVFVNLNSPSNTIMKLYKQGVEELPNGLNEDGILLRSSDDIKPFTYLPDASMRKGFRLIKELLLDTLTCEKEQRWLVISWLVSAFLLDFSQAHALMKFAGGSAAGKSKCAGRLSHLLYGEDQVGNPSAAAAYSEASRNPMVIIDNLESGDFNNSILKFLLLAATGGQKTKRSSGTESGTTKEKPKALILVTAIEPFLKPELINRTIEIEFNARFKNDGFVEDEVIGNIQKNRDLMMSCILKLVATQIIPNLTERKKYITILQKEYRGHSKDRMNEYLALLMLILDKVLPYMPFYGEDDVNYGMDSGAKEIRKAWITTQDAQAKETEVSSNTIMKLLDGIIRECTMRMKEIDVKTEDVSGYDEPMFYYRHPEYGLHLFKSRATNFMEDDEGYSKSYIEFEATSKDIVFAFDKFCRNNGLKNPYNTGAVFGSRLKNDVKLLQKGGWELITKEGIEPYAKVVKGRRFYKFRHVIIR